MEFRSKTLGYFLLHHRRDEEGIADTSIENLVSSGHQSKLPFLNRGRFERLSEGGIEWHAIDSTEYAVSDKIRWTPSIRFLYQMFTLGRYSELGIPKNKLLTVTNRKTIMKLTTENGSRSVSIKTLMKMRDYGRCLSLSYSNQNEQDFFHDRRSSNTLLGLKFNSYLVNGEGNLSPSWRTTTDVENSDCYTLFSIHSIEIGNVYFVYEAEIDAIEWNEQEMSYSLLEIKMDSREEEAASVFQKYIALSKRLAWHERNGRGDIQEMSRMLKQIADNSNRFYTHLLQGELGNVNKFIYGFTNNKRIYAKQFPCVAGTLLKQDLVNLNDFVQLLENISDCSKDIGITWDEWKYWEVLKDEYSMRIERDGEILSELDLWSTV